MPIHPIPKFGWDSSGFGPINKRLGRSYEPEAHLEGPGRAISPCSHNMLRFRKEVQISRSKRSFAPNANPRTVLSAIADQEKPNRDLRRASSVPLMPPVISPMRDANGNIKRKNAQGYFSEEPPATALTEADRARSSRIAMRWMPMESPQFRLGTPSAGGVHLAAPRSRPTTSLEGDHLVRQLGGPPATKPGTRTAHMGITRCPAPSSHS